jgi:hypothetical protein
MDRRQFTQFAGLSVTGTGRMSVTATGTSLTEARAAAASTLMAAYPVTDLGATVQAASTHLRALASHERPARESDRKGMHEAQAMFGVVLGDALADLGRLGEATRVLDTAEQHAHQIGHRGLLAWVAGTRAQGHILLGDPYTALDIIGMALPGAKDSPGLTRLYAIAAHAYALRGGGTEAAAALWLARTTAEKYTESDDVFGVPFRTFSQAEVACAAASTHAVLRNNKRAQELAEMWMPIVDSAGHTALRGHFRGAHALALARTEPDEAAALMTALLTAASEFGELGVGVHDKARMFLDRALPTPAVHDVAEMYRTLSKPAEAV